MDKKYEYVVSIKYVEFKFDNLACAVDFALTAIEHLDDPNRSEYIEVSVQAVKNENDMNDPE